MVWTSGWLCETGSLRSCFCVFHFTKVRRATRGTQGKVDKDDSSALYAARKLTSRRRQRGNNTRLLLFPRRVSRSDPICVCGQDSNLQKKAVFVSLQQCASLENEFSWNHFAANHFAEIKWTAFIRKKMFIFILLFQFSFAEEEMILSRRVGRVIEWNVFN